MKITLTIQDTEVGHCKIDSDPPIPKLQAMNRAGDITPAGGYAIIALAAMMKGSLKEAQEKMKAKYRSQIIYQDNPRLKM